MIYFKDDDILYSAYELNFQKFDFDLQLFAAEDEGRTEDPTDKKIREAREKGQVAKTDEFPQSLVVIMGFLGIFFFSGWIFSKIRDMMRYYFTSFSSFAVTDMNIKSVLSEGARIFNLLAYILLPLFAVTFIAAVFGNVIQVGFQFSSHPLKPDISKIKITPDEMLKKIFFSKQVAMNLFKSIFKILVIALSSYLIIRNDFNVILKSVDLPLTVILSKISFMALKIILWSAILLIILAVPDYFFQKREFIDSLKMSKQEVKEELKESMGDPHMKARLKEMQRDILTRNMIKEVPKADVVVTNPTHFAVALKWDRATMEAPSVTAKGVDSMALRIKRIARENDVTTIENRPLAQELYKRLEIGDIIPEDMFKVVSELYSVLYSQGKFQEAI